MILIYVGLAFGYGYLSLVTTGLDESGLKNLLIGLIWASTLLHFYYDGFIWKVRERSTRSALGLDASSPDVRKTPLARGELLHLLKWSPFVLLLSWLSYSELQGSYAPPEGRSERIWPSDDDIARNENITQIVPDNIDAQARLAVMLDNVGRTEESIQHLEDLLKKHPEFGKGHLILGEIHHRIGSTDVAMVHYHDAVKHSRENDELSIAHYRIGEIYLTRGEFDSAENEFGEALQFDPDFQPANDALQILTDRAYSRP